MRSRNIFIWGLLAPFFFFLLFFRVIPIVGTFLELVDMNSLAGTYEIFLRGLRDLLFWTSLRNTFTIFCFILIIKIPLAVGLSLILSKVPKGLRKVSLSILYIPSVIGSFAYAIFFRYLFTFNGVVNTLVHTWLGFQIPWFDSSLAAQIMLSLTMIWSSLGIATLFFLNGMLKIPQDYYDVLAVNGGKLRHEVFWIVLPNLKPQIKTIIFYTILESLLIVDLPMNLTQGGPDNSSLTIGYYIFKQAFQFGDFSYASVLGLFLMILVLFLLGVRKLAKF